MYHGIQQAGLTWLSGTMPAAAPDDTDPDYWTNDGRTDLALAIRR